MNSRDPLDCWEMVEVSILHLGKVLFDTHIKSGKSSLLMYLNTQGISMRQS
jgi:hypothetical protein